MDLFDRKKEMVQTLMDLLSKSSVDEMEKGRQPAGGVELSSVKAIPADEAKEELEDMDEDKMSLGGLVSPHAEGEEDKPFQNLESPVVQERHREEDPEDVPAIARLRRRK